MIITGPVIILDLQCRGFGSVAIEEHQCMAYGMAELPDLQWCIILDWKLNESVVLFLNVVFYHPYQIENRGLGLVPIEEQHCMAWQSYTIFNDASFPVSFGRKLNKSVVFSLNVVFFQSYRIEYRGFGLVPIEEQQCMAWQSYQVFNDASFSVSFRRKLNAVVVLSLSVVFFQLHRREKRGFGLDMIKE